MKKERQKPQKSLRTILMTWLLMFSIVPLAFITGYSLVKYEQAIDQELYQRLIGNKREIQVIIEEFYKDLEANNKMHAEDKSLIYDLSSNSIEAARELSTKWMKSSLSHRLSIFNREGRLEVSLHRSASGDILRQQNLEGKDVYLSDEFLQDIGNKDQIAIADFNNEKTLDLILFSRIISSKGSLLGYIEETLKIDKQFIENLKHRLNLEIFFMSKDGEKIVASHEDLSRYRHGFFLEKYNEQKEKLFELNIRDIPFGMTMHQMKWGDDPFYIGIGASKQAVKAVLKNVNYAFFSVLGAIIILLIILSFFFSRALLQPVNHLVDLVQNVDFDGPPIDVQVTSNTELGILENSFNKMFLRVQLTQRELKENIKKLEVANVEIRETQAKLVHTAKMASLGQLVAGVAHELNNPISFIYSNMSHLRDYSQRLFELIKVVETNPKSLPSEKERLEFDYMINDLPKLIRSCEEGARRTRDIVLGLRNFSRLDEAKVKEIDIHEGIDSTLALLSGEFKSRIKIHKTYGSLPKVICYPSQLNQVFMNILSNAIQSIPDQGDIFISTRLKNPNQVEISIRDTGVGMSVDTKEKLFDPFFTTKEINSGTGLGMSITYGIIQKHNGEISVNSAPGKGSEFTIILPVTLQPTL